MMNRFFIPLLLCMCAAHTQANDTISEQIDKDTWSVISQSVVDRDIVAMGSTYHPDAVVVNAEKTSPIATTLIRWGKGMQQELESGASARVAFRFSQRMDNESSAFESGIFNYISTDAAGIENSAYMKFESLLVKKDGRWLVLMEHQLEETDQAAWDAIQ